jgi:hypothetical protein
MAMALIVSISIWLPGNARARALAMVVICHAPNN